MAKKPQITANVSSEVFGEFWGVRMHAGASNTQMTVAAFLAWMMSSETARRQTISMAAMIDEGDVDWSVAMEWVENTRGKKGRSFAEIIAKARLRKNLSGTLGPNDTAQDEKSPKTKCRRVK